VSKGGPPAAVVEIKTVDPTHPDARRCVRSYFAELDSRSESGFDPATDDRQARAAAATRSRSSCGQPTLVATGAGGDFFEQAPNTIAASLPQAERLTLEGQGHVVDPKALAPLRARFFGAL
jgi:hypothetical protein